MASTSSAFADYPEPIEGPLVKYELGPANNPVLRGTPLAVAGALVCRLPMLQRFLWSNAGFGTIKNMSILDDIPYTFHPCVTPLGETGPMLDFDQNLVKIKHEMSNTRYYSAADYHAMYKSGQLTPLQVAKALLSVTSRDPSNEPSKYQNAWADSHGKDHLALEAARASTERYASGKFLGVLDGVPIGVKDDIEVEGYVCHKGMRYNASVPFFKEQTETSWPIKKLQEAGAVVIGKNCMHEAGSETSGINAAQGTPTNHLNPEYCPGGSSSGAGSSLGAGVVPICIGTDAGGSIRIPTNFNGAYGLKTSHHRTVFMNNTMCIVGPMAANAADLTLAYRVMSQPNPDCATQGRFGLSIPPQPSARRVMGVYRAWWDEADPRVAELCYKAVDYFAAERGYEIVDISIPYIAEAQLAHASICLSEMGPVAHRMTPNPAHWFSLVGPTNQILFSMGSQTPAEDFLQYNALRTLIMRHLAFLFQKHPGLLIMTPTTPLIGWPSHPGDEAYGVSDGNATIRNMLYVFLANLTGTPSVTAPVGYVEPEQGQGKLPVSLMATGDWGSEEQLLAWAGEADDYLHETYVDGRRRPETWLDTLNFAKGEKMA